MGVGTFYATDVSWYWPQSREEKETIEKESATLNKFLSVYTFSICAMLEKIITYINVLTFNIKSNNDFNRSLLH